MGSLESVNGQGSHGKDSPALRESIDIAPLGDFTDIIFLN